MKKKEKKNSYLCLDSNLWPPQKYVKNIWNGQKKIVGPMQDSNHRPIAFKPNVLTTTPRHQSYKYYPNIYTFIFRLPSFST